MCVENKLTKSLFIKHKNQQIYNITPEIENNNCNYSHLDENHRIEFLN